MIKKIPPMDESMWRLRFLHFFFNNLLELIEFVKVRAVLRDDFSHPALMKNDTSCFDSIWKETMKVQNFMACQTSRYLNHSLAIYWFWDVCASGSIEQIAGKTFQRKRSLYQRYNHGLLKMRISAHSQFSGLFSYFDASFDCLASTNYILSEEDIKLKSTRKSWSALLIGILHEVLQYRLIFLFASWSLKFFFRLGPSHREVRVRNIVQ